MNKYTVDDIMELRPKPCEDYDRQTVTELGAGRKSLSLAEMCKLSIPVKDIIWIVVRLMSEKDRRLFACSCAEHVLWIYEKAHPDDKRLRECIDTARKYAHGKVTVYELDAARFATRDAATDAGSAAAYAAAEVAYRDEIWDAAWWATDYAASAASAASAARGAARDAARAAEQQWQLNCLIGYVTEEK